MIRSYRDKDTEKFAGGESVRRFQSFARVAYRKIKYLMAAGALEDLRVPPGNHLEALSGDTALRFARFFGTTPEVWQNLQSQYEMDVAKGKIWSKIMKTVRPLRRSAACL